MSDVRTPLDNLTAKVSGSLRPVNGPRSAGRASWSSRPTPPRTLAARARALLPFLVYAIGYLLAESVAWRLAFALSPKIEGNAPLIVHSAVTVAALLLAPRKHWWLYLGLTAPLIAVNAWLFQLAPSWSLVWTALLLYLGILTVAVATVGLLRRFVGGPLRFETTREVSGFVLCACGGAILPACIFTVGRIVLFSWTFWFSWETAYLGSVLAILVFTPAIVLWARTDLHGLRAMVRQRLVEVVLLGLGLLVTSAVVFGVRYQDTGLAQALTLLLVPLLLWAVGRFGVRGIASALALITLIAITGATKGAGPFVSPSAVTNVFALQLCLILVSVPFLFLSAITRERAATMARLNESAVHLQESEARFRTAFESAAVGMALVGLDGHPLEVNRALVEMLGYAEEEVRTHAFRDFTYPEDEEPNLTLFRQAVAGEIASYEVEKRYRHKDGHLVWGHLSAGVVRDTTGKALYVVAHIQDISSRKQLEREQVHLLEAEQEAKHRLETVLEMLPAAVSIADTQGKLLQVNQAFRDAWGEHALGEDIEEYRIYRGWHPNGRPMTPEDWALTRALRRGETVRGQEVDIQTFDGTRKTILNNAAPLRDDAGAIVGGVVAFVEITARKQLERERTRAAILDARGHEFQTLADHSPDVIARLDPSGHYLYVNQRGADLLGLPAEHWVGKTFADLDFTQSIAKPAAQAFQEVVQAHAPRSFDTVALAPDGQTRSLHVRYVPECSEDGTLLSVLAIATDVSALKQAEARLAEQASQLEIIFDAMADGILVHDTQGTILQVNPAYRKLLGLEVDPAYVTSPLRERVRRLQVTDEQGQPIPEEQSASRRALRGEVLTGPRARDVQMRTLDGRDIWVSTAGAPIRGREGQITGVVLILRDVTARRALEQRVREQASQLEAIVMAMSDGVAVYDQAGHLVRANPALGQLMGVAADAAYVTLSLPERAKLLHIYDEAGQLLAANQWPHWRVLRGEILAGSTMTRTRIRTLDGGREVWVETSGAPIYDVDGQIIGAVLVTRDITERRALERQVAEQASELEAIFAAMTDGVFVLDADGRTTHMNPAGRVLFGRSPGEVVPAAAEERALGLDLRDGAGQPLLAEQLPTHRLLRGEILAGETALMFHLRAHDGHERTVSLTGGPLRDAGGHVIGAVGVLRDVTRIQQLQVALATQERQFRTLVENSPDIIARFDRDLRYLYMSPAIRQLSPVPLDSYLGKTNAELGIPEAHYAPAHRAIEQVFQTSEPRTLEESDEALLGPAEARYFRAQLLPEHDADGRVESVLTVTTEITPLKRTERALREAQAEAEAARQWEAQQRALAEWRGEIAESLRSVLGALNSKQPLSGILQLIVRQAEPLLGSEAAAIYGLEPLTDGQPLPPQSQAMTIQAVQGLHLDDRRSRPHKYLPFAHAAIQHALTSEQPVILWDACGPPAVGGTSDHSNRSVNIPWLQESLPAPYQTLLVLPIRVYDGIYGCLLLFYTQLCRFTSDEMTLTQAFADQVAQAITNARLQAHIEQEASTAERNKLARELHDTVTQEIFSASLIAESLPAVWRTHRAEAEAGLQDLHALTRSAQAGLRALLLELRPGELEQSPLSEALRKLGAAMSTRAGVPITISLDGAEPSLPPAAKVAFYRVAQETLMNAAKYAQAHAISVRLRSQAKNQIELEIADNGQGFDPSAIPSGHYGLAMMRERVQSVGARIHITSAPGQGTHVLVVWKRASANRRAQP